MNASRTKHHFRTLNTLRGNSCRSFKLFLGCRRKIIVRPSLPMKKSKTAAVTATATATATLVASSVAAASAALFSASGNERLHRASDGKLSPQEGNDNSGDQNDKFAPRFDGLRFIETLVTAHR